MSLLSSKEANVSDFSLVICSKICLVSSAVCTAWGRDRDMSHAEALVVTLGHEVQHVGP